MCNVSWAKLLVAILILSIYILPAGAVSSEYQNNLSNIDIKKIGEEALNIVIYTDKPYNEPLNIMKKKNNEYVLLLPEVSNSIQPNNFEQNIKKYLADIVKDIELKHFSYPSKDVNNGYTKITIKTKQPVGIVAETQTTQVSPKTFPVEKNFIPKKEISKQINNPVTEKQVQKEITPPIPITQKNELKTLATKKITPVSTIPTPIKKEELPKIATKKKQEQQKNIKETLPNEFEKKNEQVSPIETPLEIENTVSSTLEQPYSEIPYDSTINNAIKESWRQKENILLTIALIFLCPLIYLLNILKKETQTPTQILKETLNKKQRRQHKTKRTKYQSHLQDIIDNSNLTWQEKYRLLKNNEATEVENNLKKQFTDKELKHLADKYTPSSDLYEQNFGKFVSKQPDTNNPIPPSSNSSSENFSRENTEDKTPTKTQIVPPLPPAPPQPTSTKATGITPQERAYGIQGNIGGLTKKNNVPIENKKDSETPELIGQVKISQEKGFYLTKFQNEFSLIGYDKNNVYVIKKFGSKNIKSIQARLNEKTTEKQTYIVKADDYKALVEVSDKMKLILEL